MIDYLSIPQISLKGRDNKLSSLQNKLSLGVPNINENIISLIFSSKLHTESIKHIFILVESEVIITTGYDKTVKLTTMFDGVVIGALQQGLNSKSIYNSEFEGKTKWNFYLNTKLNDRQTEEDTNKILDKLRTLEQRGLYDQSMFLKEGRSFMEPQTLMKLIKVVDPLKTKQLRLLSPEHKRANFSKSELPRNFSILPSRLKSSTELELKSLEEHTHLNKSILVKDNLVKCTTPKKKYLNLSFSSKVSRLPSLSKIHKSQSQLISNNILKPKLSKAVFRLASKLADAFDEPDF